MLSQCIPGPGHHIVSTVGVDSRARYTPSPYNSLSQPERSFLTMPFFSLLHDPRYTPRKQSKAPLSSLSCMDEEIMLRVLAIGGTFNPYIETLNDVLSWETVPARRMTGARHSLLGGRD